MASTKRKDSKGYALRVGFCQEESDGYSGGSNTGEKAGSNGQSSG